MKGNRCETTPATVGQWLRCGMCWEVKGGVILLLISKVLMLWGHPPVSSLRWRAGWAVFWRAVGSLGYGLIRDIRLIATTKFGKAGVRASKRT